MADNYRLTKTTITGVTNSGSNSARIYASEAEKKATEALAKAEEALNAATNLNDASKLVLELNDKLDAEIQRSTLKDAEHSTDIAELKAGDTNIVIIKQPIDAADENFWTKED
jgi:hypothetical protein